MITLQINCSSFFKTSKWPLFQILIPNHMEILSNTIWVNKVLLDILYSHYFCEVGRCLVLGSIIRGD